ncbi:MAG: hypothetical protein M1829_003888 [Trizodia sp. TS-e1964]|nr:MAG: hypothetical protein M1829_003888 [Trizodia sp. TS-e1964]
MNEIGGTLMLNGQTLTTQRKPLRTIPMALRDLDRLAAVSREAIVTETEKAINPQSTRTTVAAAAAIVEVQAEAEITIVAIPPAKEIGRRTMEALQAEMLSWMGYLLKWEQTTELINNYQVEGVENIRVIRDRWSGISRQFAYIRFSSINTAKVFLQKNYPAIYLVGAGIASNQDGADQTKVRIAFSREREDRDRDRQGRLDGVDDWNCAHCSALNFQRRTECFQCGTFKDDDGTTGPLPHIQPQYVNTGDNDVSHDGTPSQFLLLRNLEPSVTEDILAKGVCKLYKSSEDHSLPAHPIPNKRIESRAASGTANVNVGATEGSLRRVLLVRDRGNNESWRFAFAEFATVEDSHAALKKFAVMEKFTISSKPVLVTHPHTGVFIPALANDRFSFSPLHNLAARLVYWDQAAYVSELVIQVEEPKKPESGAAKSKKSTTEGKSKKRKADSAASANPKKTAPAHLEFWHNRQAELHEIEHIIQRVEAAPPASAKAKVITTNTPDKSFESFADRTRKCCLLCSRQFKTDEEVEKHERISQLHKDNLKNPKLKEKAILKLSKVKNAADDAVASAYRDRAKERRETFNQPKKPAPEITSLIDQPHAPTKEKSPPRQSKGAALLSKMGWTEGSGLGAQGTGILVPIASDMYVQGVGLGAEGGKIGDASLEAERNTKDSYSSFVERAKDKAKERFDRMQ